MVQAPEITLRPYAPADAPHVVALVNADAGHRIAARRAVLDGAGHVRLVRYVSPSSAKVVAVDERGALMGYSYVSVGDHGIVSETGGAVHPDHWGRGIGTRLLAWAEQRARAGSAGAPAGVKTVLQANVFEAQHNAIRLLTRQRFARVREWAHLELQLAAPPPAPRLPPGITIRPMDLDQDWDLVGPAMDRAFADHWGTITLPLAPLPDVTDPAPEEAQDHSYSNTPGACFVAWAADAVAGGILCNTRLVERADTGRVGSLFVGPDYRRRGVGQALMGTAFQEFWRRGLRRIITDTDAESFSDTPRFYAQLGMRLYRREYLYEKELNPGTDVRRLER
ncbi:MAG TPA: GNAT family N-acetyltransferase [Chloroflexia bacterium]|nr:GNAT family N-acetyltransferase [Chloroflexia bacterium]